MIQAGEENEMQVTPSSLAADGNLNFAMLLSEGMKPGGLLWMGKWLKHWDTSSQLETGFHNSVAVLTAQKLKLRVIQGGFTPLIESQDVSSLSQHRTSCGGNMDPIFCLIPIHAPLSPLAFKEQFLLHARVSPLNQGIAICSPLVEGLFVLNSCRISTQPPGYKDCHYKLPLQEEIQKF